MTHLFKSFLIAATLTGFAIPSFAQDNHPESVIKDELEISSQIQTTRQDIANIQVVSEFCPTLIGKNKNFDDGINKLLAMYLPGISNPSLAMQALSEEADYQEFLKEARDLAATQTQEKNREICLSIIEWNKKK